MTRILVAIALAATLVAGGCRRSETPAPETAGSAAATAPSETMPAAPPSNETTGEVGSLLPEYSATGLDGSKFDLASKRDKVLLLNVWATWCGPCRFEIPELQKIHDKYASRGFEVIGVSVDESGTDPVRQFVEEYKMTYPVVIDAEGKLAAIFRTSVLPTSAIVDRSGKILWKKVGPLESTDQEMIRAIEAAL